MTNFLKFIKKHYLLSIIGILIIIFIGIPFILSMVLNNCDDSLDDYYGSMLGSIIAFCGVILSLYFSRTEIRKEKKDDLLNSLHVNDYKSLNDIISTSSSLNDTCINIANYIKDEFTNNYVSAVMKHGLHVSAKQQLSNVVTKLQYILHKTHLYRYTTVSHLQQITEDTFFDNDKFSSNLNDYLQNYDNNIDKLHKSYKSLEEYLEAYNIGQIPKVNEYSGEVNKSVKYLNQIGSNIKNIGSLCSEQLNSIKSNLMKSIVKS